MGGQNADALLSPRYDVMDNKQLSIMPGADLGGDRACSALPLSSARQSTSTMQPI